MIATTRGSLPLLDDEELELLLEDVVLLLELLLEEELLLELLLDDVLLELEEQSITTPPLPLWLLQVLRPIQLCPPCQPQPLSVLSHN